MSSLPDANFAARVASRALSGRALARCEAVSGGLLNAVFRISIEGLNDEFALRVYTRDALACAKEVDLHRLIAIRVPIPEILFAGPADDWPWVLMRWVPGETYRQIKSRRDPLEIAECGRAMGRALAQIGSFQFARGGMIGPALAIGPGPVEGPNAVPRMIEQFLGGGQAVRRMPAASITGVCDFAWSHARQLAEVEDGRCLVHSDFGSPNLVMHRPRGCWEVAAVLDWEFAFSGSPLYDVGHALRYERPDHPGLEPHFSEAYRAAGGRLRDDWRDVARTLDLTALCEMLSRETLPESMAREIVGLIERTTCQVSR